MNTFLIYFLAIISGGIGVLAFSPFDYWLVAFVSASGLIWITKTQKNSTALWGSFLWGLSFFTIGVNWLNVSIHQFGGSPLWLSYGLVVLLSAYLALYPTFFTYLIRRFNIQSAVLFPIIWTFTEFLRGWIFTGFPWLQFGYSLIDSPFAGIAPFFGVNGLTFLVIWISTLLVNNHFAFKDRKILLIWGNIAIMGVILVAAFLSDKVQFTKPQPERALTVTLAQGNIEQNLKWDPDYLYSTLDIYASLIREQVSKSDLIVLPESAFPALENQLVASQFYETLQNVAKQSKTDLLIGSIYLDENTGKLLNSLVLVDEQDFISSQAQRYSKHHLVPFGEYVPLENLLRPLGSVFNLPMSAFASGETVQPNLQIKGRNFNPAICYEIILGSQVQKNLKADTDFLITVSNDAWFGESIGPWQHLQMARMRALELGKPLIRSTNTGISVFVDEKGKLIKQAPQFEQTTLTHKLIPTTGKTPYAALGNMPLYCLCLLLLAMRGVRKLMKKLVEKI